MNRQSAQIILDFLDDESFLFDFIESNKEWFFHEEKDDLSFDRPSTFIGTVAYSPFTQSLDVELNGKIYRYCGISFDFFTSFKRASSKGGFYNRMLKNRFTCG